MPGLERAGARLVVLFIMLFVTGRPALAQASWDIAGLTGGWWGRPEDASIPAQYDDDWFGAWSGSFSVGRYWTPHIKTELDATIAGEGDRYVTRQIVLPGERSPRFFSSEEHWQERSLAALVTVQAGRNWWVHPYLQGGVSFDWDRVRSDSFPIFIGQTPVWPPNAVSGTGTRQVTRGVIGGGAKFYVSERAFFRAEVRTSFGGGSTHAQFRTGFGADF